MGLRRARLLLSDLALDRTQNGDESIACGIRRSIRERIQATVVDTNAASVRVLEKTGFAREGLLRGYRRVRGAPRDLWMYARLAP